MCGCRSSPRRRTTRSGITSCGGSGRSCPAGAGWRNREKRPAYEAAVNEMLERTDPTWARWHVIPGDSKHWARLDVVEKVCDAIEAELHTRGYDLSGPEQVTSKA